MTFEFDNIITKALPNGSRLPIINAFFLKTIDIYRLTIQWFAIVDQLHVPSYERRGSLNAHLPHLKVTAAEMRQKC